MLFSSAVLPFKLLFKAYKKQNYQLFDISSHIPDDANTNKSILDNPTCLAIVLFKLPDHNFPSFTVNSTITLQLAPFEPSPLLLLLLFFSNLQFERNFIFGTAISKIKMHIQIHWISLVFESIILIWIHASLYAVKLCLHDKCANGMWCVRLMLIDHNWLLIIIGVVVVVVDSVISFLRYFRSSFIHLR